MVYVILADGCRVLLHVFETLVCMCVAVCVLTTRWAFSFCHFLFMWLKRSGGGGMAGWWPKYGMGWDGSMPIDTISIELSSGIGKHRIFTSENKWQRIGYFSPFVDGIDFALLLRISVLDHINRNVRRGAWAWALPIAFTRKEATRLKSFCERIKVPSTSWDGLSSHKPHRRSRCGIDSNPFTHVCVRCGFIRFVRIPPPPRPMILKTQAYYTNIMRMMKVFTYNAGWMGKKSEHIRMGDNNVTDK